MKKKNHLNLILIIKNQENNKVNMKLFWRDSTLRLKKLKTFLFKYIV